MRRFAGLELNEDVIPDETTILNFRHLLEAHGLTSVLFEELIRETDRAVFADKGCFSDQKKKDARCAGIFCTLSGIKGVLDKAKPKKTLSVSQSKSNQQLAPIRAKVEHPFRILKCQFGYRKIRYRGIQKNGAQLFSLANLYPVRKQLLAGPG